MGFFARRIGEVQRTIGDMRMETTERTLYKFAELSESAQEHAIEKFAESESEVFDFEYDDFEAICKILGVEDR